MRNRNITKRDISIYRELTEQVKTLRKVLKKRYRKLEKEVGVGRLPALVLPESPKPVSRINWRKLRYQQYQAKIKALRLIVAGGLRGWYKRMYKDKILELWRENLIGDHPEGGINGRIKSGWYYSDEQIEDADEKTARFMLIYNRLVRMDISVFMIMYDSGMLPAFRLLYDAEKGGFHNYYLEELEDTLSKTSLKKLANLYSGMTELDKRKSEKYEESLQNYIKNRR